MRARIVLVALAIAVPLAAEAQSRGTQVEGGSRDLARVLRYVPDDADLVLVVPSVDGLVAGLSAFGAAAGAADMTAVTAAKLLEEPLGRCATAVDTAGPLVVAWSAKYDDELLIVSLSSDEDWRRTTEPTKLRDGVLLFEFGADRYAASTGKVAVFARERGQLQRALDARGQCAARLSKEMGDLLAQRQVVIHVDVAARQGELDQHFGFFMDMLRVGMAVAGPEAELGIQFWEWVLERVQRLMGEMRTLVVTLRVDGQGVLVDGRGTFTSDGQVAAYLRQVRRPRRDLLRGLPTGGAVILATEWEEAQGGPGINEILTKAMFKMESVRNRVGADKLSAVLDQSIEMHRLISGNSGVITRDPDSQAMVYSGLYLTKDGAAVQRKLRAVCDLCPELVSGWGTFPSAMKRGQCETVANVQADVYQIVMGECGDQMQPMMKVLYGQDARIYMAPHAEGVAFAFGPHDAARQQLSKVLAFQSSPLNADPRVKALLQRLSPGPQFCMLIDIPAFVEIIGGLVREFALPFPPLDFGDQAAALAGFTLYLEPQAVKAELFVPAEPIRLLIEAFEGFEDAEHGAY